MTEPPSQVARTGKDGQQHHECVDSHRIAAAEGADGTWPRHLGVEGVVNDGVNASRIAELIIQWRGCETRSADWKTRMLTDVAVQN